MDQYQLKMQGIRTDLQGQLELETRGLRTHMDQKIVVLEGHLDAKMNFIYWETTEALQVLRNQVAEVQKSQKKMWEVMNRIAIELHELVAWNASSNDEEESGTTAQLEETHLGLLIHNGSHWRPRDNIGPEGQRGSNRANYK